MNRAKTDRAGQYQAESSHTASIDAEIEAILAGDDTLIPTSGFLASVMESVQQEASAPPPIPFPPIPFPWKRALPGLLLAAALSGWALLELIRSGLPIVSAPAFTAPQLPAAFVAPVESAGWVALALGISLASWLLSRRLVGSGGLL
jgi:hypothetical protein